MPKIPQIQPLLFNTLSGKVQIPLVIRLQEYADAADLWHTHEDFAELVFIIQGSLQNEMSDECMSLQAGDVILFAPGSCHHYKRIRNSRHFTILFSPQLLNIFPSFMTSLSNYQYFMPKNGQVSKILHLDEKDLYTAISLLESIRQEQMNFSPGHEEMMFANFCSLLVHILRHGSIGAGSGRNNAIKIAQCIRYMEKHSEEHLDIKKLSSFVHMSSSSFRSHFRMQTNLSPMDYLIKLRLRKAALLIFHSDRQITDIGIDCGFGDGNYFARKFKQIFGCSPREFRRMTLANELNISEEIEKLHLSDNN